MDNIFIERLWRSLKYEAVYLHEIADGFQARRLIGDWVRSTTSRGRTWRWTGEPRPRHTAASRLWI